MKAAAAAAAATAGGFTGKRHLSFRARIGTASMNRISHRKHNRRCVSTRLDASGEVHSGLLCDALSHFFTLHILHHTFSSLLTSSFTLPTLLIDFQVWFNRCVLEFCLSSLVLCTCYWQKGDCSLLDPYNLASLLHECKFSEGWALGLGYLWSELAPLASSLYKGTTSTSIETNYRQFWGHRWSVEVNRNIAGCSVSIYALVQNHIRRMFLFLKPNVTKYRSLQFNSKLEINSITEALLSLQKQKHL